MAAIESRLGRKHETVAGVDVRGRKSDRFRQIGFHDRHEALHVGLLIGVSLNVAGLHLLQDVRLDVEAADDDLSGRNAAVL